MEFMWMTLATPLEVMDMDAEVLVGQKWGPVSLRSRAAGQGGHGKFDCTQPHGTDIRWALDCEKPWDSTWGMRKAQFGVPTEL